MPEYIEREIALKQIKKEGINQAEEYAWRYHPVVMAYGDCYGIVKSIPAVDVVEVVRCMDCRHRYQKDWEMRCPYHSGPVAPMDYCSCGERRENVDA